MRYIADDNSVIFLGKQGENLAREVVFPVAADWEARFGMGNAEALYQPAGAEEPQAIALTRLEDGTRVWTITAADTNSAGYGRCELRYLVGGVLVKSRCWLTYVAAALGWHGGAPGQDRGLVTTHAATHAAGGTDPIAPADIGAMAAGDVAELDSGAVRAIWEEE